MPALKILIYILSICFSCNAFSTSKISKAEKNINNVEVEQYNHKQIQKIDNRLKSQEAQIKRLSLTLDNKLEHHVLQIEEQRSQFLDYVSKQRIKNYTALSIILFGLLLEIIGALLLGTSSFSSKIKKLINFDMRFTTGSDFQIEDPKRNQILTNYSILGNIFLWVGFSVQFVGTAYLLDLSWQWKITIVFIGVLFGCLVFFWLLGINSFVQTRYQKCKILLGNITRLVRIIMISLLQCKKQCDICLKRIQKNKVSILWYDEGNYKPTSYIHTPHDFLIGHEKCLNTELECRIENEGNFEIKKEIKAHHHINGGEIFITNKFHQYKEWFKEYYKHRSQKRSDYSIPSSDEMELDKAVEKIRRINK